jgi:hypothetical protein
MFAILDFHQRCLKEKEELNSQCHGATSVLRPRVCSLIAP